MLAVAVRGAVRAAAGVAPAAGQAVPVEPGRSSCVLKGETSFLWSRKKVYQKGD